MDVCIHCVGRMPGPLPIVLGLLCLAVLVAIAMVETKRTSR